ncbi:putative peptidylprolyl isomerase [Helianthus anomalus]
MLVAKSDGVEFTVQDGHFCPMLSKVVKTMKKGEKVLLTIKPQLAFVGYKWIRGKGKEALGNKGVVPASATLQITLELVSWKMVYDVTKDRKVMKKILKEGEGYERPNEGVVVQEQVIDGLDRAAMTMKKGEVVILTIAPEYAFGSTESKQELVVVPPNSTVIYEIELNSFIKVGVVTRKQVNNYI